MGTHRVKVTFSNVPASLPDHVLASFLSKYGSVEGRQLNSRPYWRYGQGLLFPHLFEEEGVHINARHKKTNNDWQIRVVLERRKPLCWSCRQQGHLAVHCSLKMGGKPKCPAVLVITPCEEKK